MDKIVAQTLFHTTTAERRSWQSYASSTGIHVIVTVALFFVTFPTIKNAVKPDQRVTLLDPSIPKWKPKVVPPPPVANQIFLKEQAIVLPKPKPVVIPPPVVKPPEQPKLLAKAPEIEKQIPIAQPLPEVKLAPPAPPKPDVKTGVFNSSELAKGPREPQQVKTGGFGDPNGVPASTDSRPARLMMARLGGFDMPNGEGHGGGGGHAQSGGVRSAGFGSAGDPNGVPGGTGTHGTVRTGGFGDGTIANSKPGGNAAAKSAEPAMTQVEILFKPKPVYSSEARNLRLEGQVSLNVIFGADGSVRVLGVQHGLGHGLDEAAQQAATQVRFKPATRGGAPVDINATIYITFQLT